MRVRVAVFVAMLSLGGAVVPACGFVVPNPCDEKKSQSQRMNGRWNLVTVNGQDPGILGFPMPNTTDRLKFAALTFTMTDLSADCDENGKATEKGTEIGRVIAQYDVLAVGGTQKPPQFYTGTYVYDYSDFSVSLHALSKSALGNRIQNDLRFTADDGPFKGLALRFSKQP